MRSETTWYAFDETEFSSREDCEEYEQHIQALLKSVIFLNDEREIMHDPQLGDIEIGAFYMYIIDADKARALFDWIPNYISFGELSCGISSGDRLVYNSDTGKWDNIDAQARALNEKIKDLDEVLAGILEEKS